MNDQPIEVEREDVLQVMTPTKVSQLENDLDYQTKTEVESAVEAEATLRETADEGLQSQIDTKQGTLEAGDNITIDGNNKISAYAAPLYSTTGDNTDGAMTQKATTSALNTEATARQSADIGLQGQIDAISASSDVADIVGTKADLNSYDTSKLTDKAIIKVLADESQGGATTYYRWSTESNTFALIGSEGPYYTKSQADTDFQKKLVAGANITIGADGKTISATDTTYSDMVGATSSTAGTHGLTPAPSAGSTSRVLRADGSWKLPDGVNALRDIEVADDTPAGWISVLEGLFTDASALEVIIAYNHGGKFASQLSNWGILEIKTLRPDQGSPNVSMTWMNLSTGGVYYRTGDQSGWRGDWEHVNHDIDVFNGATSSAAGAQGTVPAPTTGEYPKFLRGNGVWEWVQNLHNTTSNLSPSSDLPNAWATTIRADIGELTTSDAGGTAVTFYSQNNKFAGQPSQYGWLVSMIVGGNNDATVRQIWVGATTNNQILFRSELGNNAFTAWSRLVDTASTGTVSTAMLADYSITTAKIDSAAVTRVKFGYGSEMEGATSSADGSRGVVPAPSAGEEGEFLRGDGTWASPPTASDSTYGQVKSSASTIKLITQADFTALTTKDPNTLYLVRENPSV